VHLATSGCVPSDSQRCGMWLSWAFPFSRSLHCGARCPFVATIATARTLVPRRSLFLIYPNAFCSAHGLVPQRTSHTRGSEETPPSAVKVRHDYGVRHPVFSLWAIIGHSDVSAAVQSRNGHGHSSCSLAYEGVVGRDYRCVPTADYPIRNPDPACVTFATRSARALFTDHHGYCASQALIKQGLRTVVAECNISNVCAVHHPHP
jgi:hypothetical protein